jgi:hypothetical protein
MGRSGSRRGIGASWWVVLGLFIWVVLRFIDSERSESSDRAAAEVDTARYRPAVQEGLGASVAILLDNSGSMEDPPDGGGSPKYQVARAALAQVLEQTEAFVAQQAGFPINVGLYVFSSGVERALPIGPYDRSALAAALARLPEPDGATAIGDAMDAAVQDLYAAGTIRKYILVVTDGENTEGRKPDRVAREIARRSDGAVRLLMVAFDVGAEHFDFVKEVRGTLLEARNEVALRAGLDTLYRGRILAEAVDAGETLPPVDTFPAKRQ